MKKIITFLGKYPKETQYSFEGQVFSGHVFAEALHQFTAYDQMLVFITEEAEALSWPVLADINDDRIVPVPIPLGKTTDEMWLIFGKILEHVDHEDSVIFDITHGLRSTPFLMFLFAAFLKFARNIKIEAIYYGAFELGNPIEKVPAPVFDLSEFVNMVDWITATDRFIVTGDGGSLTRLLREEMPPGLQMGSDLRMREIGNSLRNAANGIEAMTLALRMARPFEAMQSGVRFSRALQSSKADVSLLVQPFEALVDRIEQSYGQFELEDHLSPASALPNLMRQLGMAGWYLDHRQALQATLLMREWLVSALMAITQNYPFDNRNAREIIEAKLNQAAHQLKYSNKGAGQNFDPDLMALPDPLRVIENWQRLSQLRNDIAHCGMRQNSLSAADLIKASAEVYNELCQIANDVLPLTPMDCGQ